MEDQKALQAADQNQLAQKPEEQAIEIKAEFDIGSMVKSVGSVKLTKKQEDILFKDVPEEQVEIRPDGIVYLPHVFYSTRLRKAFGWEYSVIPKGDPSFLKEKGLVVWGFYMVVKGSLMAYAIGQQNYYDGAMMTYADAMEGAKSNAIMRLCKDLGIGTELWQPEWRDAWQKKWAYTKGVNKNKSPKWHKKKVGDVPAEKSPEYLGIVEEMRKILENPDFTGPIEYVDKETGLITPYNLDDQSRDYLAKINSPQVYGIAILERIKNHIAKLLLFAIEAKAKIPEQEKVDDALGDEDINFDEKGKGVDFSEVPEVMSPEEYSDKGDEPYVSEETQPPPPGVLGHEEEYSGEPNPADDNPYTDKDSGELFEDGEGKSHHEG